MSQPPEFKTNSEAEPQPAVVYHVSPQRKVRRWPYFVVIYILLTLLISAFVSNYMMARRIGPPQKQARDQHPKFDEIWSYGEKDGEKVVRIGLDGVIMRQVPVGLLGGSVDPIESILRQIRSATNDENVKGIIMEINSPGGAVTPSDEIYHALKTFRESAEGRKVVIFVRDLCASGGYYIAAAGNEIVAEPTALIGSIGVLMQAFNFKTLADKMGVKDVTVVSEKSTNKTLFNPLQEVDPQHKEILQQLVDQMYDKFAGIVKEGRGLKDNIMKTHADGRIFTAETAKEIGFVDEIGYWDDAVTAMQNQLGASELNVVRYSTPPGLVDMLMGVNGTERHPVAWPTWMTADPSPKLMFLWKP